MESWVLNLPQATKGLLSVSVEEQLLRKKNRLSFHSLVTRSQLRGNDYVVLSVLEFQMHDYRYLVYQHRAAAVISSILNLEPAPIG